MCEGSNQGCPIYWTNQEGQVGSFTHLSWSLKFLDDLLDEEYYIKNNATYFVLASSLLGWLTTKEGAGNNKIWEQLLIGLTEINPGLLLKGMMGHCLSLNQFLSSNHVFCQGGLWIWAHHHGWWSVPAAHPYNSLQEVQCLPAGCYTGLAVGLATNVRTSILTTKSLSSSKDSKTLTFTGIVKTLTLWVLGGGETLTLTFRDYVKTLTL